MGWMGRVALVAVLAGWAGVAAAGEPPAETEITVQDKTHLSAGVGFGGPLGAAVCGSLLHGLGADVRDEDDRVKGMVGLLVQAGAGSGGGKLSLGVGARARVDTEDFRGGVTAGLVVSVARTWGSPVGTEEGLTYLGPELELSVKHVGVSLGALWRVGGGSRGASVMFSWGVGFHL